MKNVVTPKLAPPKNPTMAPVKGYMPHLMKVWKSYVFTTGQTIKTVSPFEVNVIGSLVTNVGAKLRHKVRPLLPHPLEFK